MAGVNGQREALQEELWETARVLEDGVLDFEHEFILL